MADEELRLVATLDDRASEGLAKLQANVRQLSTGPNAQAMTQMQRQTGGVAEGLKNMSTGFSNAVTGMFAFTGIAAAIPAALAGMAVSFATSGVGAFAENLNKMAREADKTGTSLAQYKANIGVLKTAGITEQEAVATIERFTRIQTELGQMGSKVRQTILASTPLWGQDEMNEWLNNVVTLPTEQAMERVRERGKDIRRSVYDTAIAEGNTVAQASRRAADAENEWLQQWGATALANIRKPFREATRDEVALMESRRVATMAWTDATGDISSAWGDIKDTIASIAIGPLTVAAQGLAVVMRGVADAVRIVEGVFKSPPTDMLDMADRLQRSFPATANELRAISAFLDDPGQGLLDMANRLKQEFVNLIPQSVYDFFENPSPALQTMVRNLFGGGIQLSPAWQPVIDFFTNPGEGILGLINRAQAAMAGMIPQGIKDFFVNPGGGILSLIDRAQAAMAGFIPQGVKDFFVNPGEGILNSINRAQAAMAALIPQGIKDFFADPGEGVFDSIGRTQRAISGMVPQGVKDFFADPDENILDLINRAQAAMAGMIPQSVKDFFSATSENLYNLIVRIDEAIKNWVVEPIKAFFEAPGEGLRNMVNWLYDRWNDLKTLSQPFIDFFENPAQGLLTLIDQAKEKMVDFLPGPLKRLLGLEGAAATAATAPSGADLFGIEHGGGGIPAAQPAQPASLPDFSEFDRLIAEYLTPMQRGGIVNEPTPAMVGEAGPEAVMPLDWLRSMMPSREALMAAIPGIATTALWGGELAGIAPAGSYYAARRAQLGIGGLGEMPTSMRDIRNTVAQFVHPQIAGVRSAAGMLGSEAAQGALSRFLPRGLLDEITGFATAESREAFMAGRELDRSAAQQVNVSGVGRISVDVRAPEGTRVNAEGEGLFKTVEIARQTSMMPAEYGPVAATGVNAGTGTYS